MMYSVSDVLYDEVSARLREAIDGESYFSGSVETEFEGAECRLTASLILYRQRIVLPEGEMTTLADAVPVWWEFHTVIDGEERLNDFSFAELRRRLAAG